MNRLIMDDFNPVTRVLIRVKENLLVNLNLFIHMCDTAHSPAVITLFMY